MIAKLPGRGNDRREGSLADRSVRVPIERVRCLGVAQHVLSLARLLPGLGKGLEEGGGPLGTLIVTRDDEAGGIDAQAIAELIGRVLAS